MDMTLYALAKKYADSLSLGFSSVSDLGNGKIRFTLTSGGTLDVTVPTVKGDKGDKGDKGNTGEAGQDGNDGEDGFSPVVETSKVGGTATVSITDKTGTHTFEINDGQVSFNIEVVDELPDTGETGTIYLVPNGQTTSQNIHNEYLYVNDEWELIGTTEIDLSNYYTKTETDGLLNGKADKSTTYTKSEVDNKVLDTYSTTETRIGTWIDGKPLYRKVIKTTTTYTHNDLIPITNMDCCIRYGGCCFYTETNEKRSMPWNIQNYNCDINGWNTNGAYLCLKNANTNITMGPGSMIWFEYTKTTD